MLPEISSAKSATDVAVSSAESWLMREGKWIGHTSGRRDIAGRGRAPSVRQFVVKLTPTRREIERSLRIDVNSLRMVSKNRLLAHGSLSPESNESETCNG